MEALHRQVLPFLLRRMKEDVLQDLPPKIIQDYYCQLSPLQVSAGGRGQHQAQFSQEIPLDERRVFRLFNVGLLDDFLSHCFLKLAKKCPCMTTLSQH